MMLPPPPRPNPPPPPALMGIAITLVMPLARVTGICSLAGLIAISARSCGSNFPISPTSTLSRMEEISESPISVAESIMPG